MEAEHDVQGLTPERIATLALVVNELATNAIKHALRKEKPAASVYRCAVAATVRPSLSSMTMAFPSPRR
jgi:anti-sigma regulatory factor (Ser/Thr protein kinase)